MDRLNPPIYSGRHYVLTKLRKQMEGIVAQRLRGRKDLLIVDFGCGDMPYRPIFEHEGARYIGIDLADNKAADLHMSAEGVAPMADCSADVVLSTQVLEHALDPRSYLLECRRIIKPGGLLILSTHGYWMYHPHPTDLWRWTGSGLRSLVEEAGYTLLDCTGVLGLASTGLHLFQDGLHRHLQLRRPLRQLVSVAMDPLIALADKLSSDEERRDDACIFVIVAERPAN